jgi:RsiW-degrading membrane proteinase PrsW (M82 family)
LAILGLAESPILLQVLGLDRSYLFFVFSFAWATALYTFIEPPRRAFWLGLVVFIVTASLSVPLLLAWLGPEQDVPTTGPMTEQIFGFVFRVGVREELCKTASLLLLFAAGRAAHLRFTSREGLVFGAMSGLAFAAAENLQAVRQLSHLEEVSLAHGLPANPTVAVALARLALTPLAHACWTAIVGYALTMPIRSGAQRVAALVGAFVLVAFLHGLYDESAALGNRVGVGLLLGVSFTITLFVVARPVEDAPNAAIA